MGSYLLAHAGYGKLHKMDSRGGPRDKPKNEKKAVWDPGQYNRFKRERQQPFFDLLSMVKPRPGMRVVDLGCGTGELTRHLHDTLAARETLGIDSSPEMLEKSACWSLEGLSFELGDIAGFDSQTPFDLVVSNAALQWIPDHARLFHKLGGLLAAGGGQLAVQIPANHKHISHTAALRAASEQPFATALGEFALEWPVLEVSEYRSLLGEIGLEDCETREVVYSHEMASTRDVVEWTKGTLLTTYKRRISTDLYERFVNRYSEILLDELGDQSPYMYPFRRILMWGQTKADAA